MLEVRSRDVHVLIYATIKLHSENETQAEALVIKSDGASCKDASGYLWGPYELARGISNSRENLDWNQKRICMKCVPCCSTQFRALE